MDVSQVKERICGPLAPVLTVYREGDLALDLDAIRENVEQQIRQGMTTGNGVLLAAGAGGDFPLLTFEERKTVIQAVAEAAAGRATVLGCRPAASGPQSDSHVVFANGAARAPDSAIPRPPQVALPA